MLDLLQEALTDLGVRVLTYLDPEDGLAAIKQNRPYMVLLDLNMPKIHGMQVLEEIVNFDPAIEVVLLTGDYSTASAVQAIQKGAADYLTKPVSIATLTNRVTKSLEEIKTKHETFQLDGELVSSFKFQGMVARSPWMLDLFSKMRRIAPHFRTVLVGGPSGTGKELVARALHSMSPVASNSFIVCNCAGVPESLAESEWFGYVKGAFTGANQDKLGLFEHANGGTIFLDEIGEMPLNLQAKLLRVCMMADGPMIDICHLPPELSQPESGSGDSPFQSLAEIERNHVRRVMEMVGGNKLRAAEILGISRSTLYNLLAEADAPESKIAKSS
jgi:DNA-binding NtrC family response regulator